MKILNKYILIVLVLFTSLSCEKQLDINIDPLVATEADPNTILPFVMAQYSNRKVTELGTRTLDVSQHLSACFNSPRNGSTSIFLTGNTWNMMFTQVLGNLVVLEIQAQETGPSFDNVAAVSGIIKAMVFYELSSIWEDVPFSEALDGAQFLTPKFDSQEDVFRGVVTQLDEAMAIIDGMPTEVLDISTGDILYGGDMDNWRRFANSLKLRVLMLIRNKDTSVDSQITAVLSQPLIEDNSQAAIIRYADVPGNSNAFAELVTAFFGGTNQTAGVYAPGEFTYDLMYQNGDPRSSILLFDPSLTRPVNGLFAFSNPTFARVSDNVIRNNLPQMWFLPAEISFYRAELALKGATGENAQQFFDLGLTQILEWWGGDIPGAQLTLSAAQISTFIGGLAAVTLNDVYEQQYLETFMRPIVAWNHVRRTKVPALVPPPTTSISTYLKRFNYAPAESAANPNTPANLATDAPMWFEN